MQINNYNNLNFKAGTVANCSKLKLYRVKNNYDINVLKEFCSKTDIKKLMPDIEQKEADRWKEMLELAVDNAQNPGNVTYVESYNGKLCGIITYFPGLTAIIDTVCAVPVKVGEKVKFGGKSLFCPVFEDFLNYGGSRIKLSAITNGPYNTINKYTELGFMKTSDVKNTYTEMVANKYKVKEAFKKLKELIGYKPCKEENVDLKDLI